jgi:hypothetical protein
MTHIGGDGGGGAHGGWVVFRQFHQLPSRESTQSAANSATAVVYMSQIWRGFDTGRKASAS